MKKIFYSMLMALSTLAMTSCDEDFASPAGPQTWEQEAPVTIPGCTASATEAVDLATADEVKVFNTTMAQMPEGTTVADYRLEVLTGEEGAEQKTTVNATAEGMVKSADLQAIIEQTYGKRPTERELKANVFADVLNGGQASLLALGQIIIKATPKAPVIANSYYLVGDMFGWDEATMVQFNHSGNDVYEDPVFTIMFSTTKADSYWKIIPEGEGDIWSRAVVGTVTDGDDALEGTLVNVNAQAGKIVEQGMYLMTINMMDYTYSLKQISPEYYLVGALQGWNSNPAQGKTCILYPHTAMLQSYTTKWENDANCKIWLGADFGAWDNCYGATYDGATDAEGTLVSVGAGAMVCPEKGAYYTLTVDFKNMHYTWTKLDNQEPAAYSQVSIIGDFNGWGGDADMKEVAPHNWYAEGVEIAAGGFKFRANHDWGTNWGIGGNNGDNITSEGGTYNVYFNDITGEYVLVAQ